MWKLHVLFAFCLATAGALPRQERIIGGSVTSISQYPFAVVFLISTNNADFRQNCGGTIINNRSAMSAAHCWADKFDHYRLRVGSTNAHSGGAVHNVARYITHPDYNVGTYMNSDIGILRVATPFVFGNNVRPGSIPATTFAIADNTNVWSIGWGVTSFPGSRSEQLRHVQLKIINQAQCQRAYGNMVNANKICAGWSTNGRGACHADSGSPLVHNGVAIGVTSFGISCAQANFPNVYARVSRFTPWLASNA